MSKKGQKYKKRSEGVTEYQLCPVCHFPMKTSSETASESIFTCKKGHGDYRSFHDLPYDRKTKIVDDYSGFPHNPHGPTWQPKTRPRHIVERLYDENTVWDSIHPSPEMLRAIRRPYNTKAPNPRTRTLFSGLHGDKPWFVPEFYAERAFRWDSRGRFILPTVHKGETVEEFCARGGKVKVLPPYIPSKSMKNFLSTTWNIRRPANAD